MSRAQPCEICGQVPPPPWIYCQDEACSRASLSRLVGQTSWSRAKKASAERAGGRQRLATQEGASCPLCRELIADLPSSSCTHCKTTYHNDCLLELTGSRCSTVGCNRYVPTED